MRPAQVAQVMPPNANSTVSRLLSVKSCGIFMNLSAGTLGNANYGATPGPLQAPFLGGIRRPGSLNVADHTLPEFAAQCSSIEQAPDTKGQHDQTGPET